MALRRRKSFENLGLCSQALPRFSEFSRDAPGAFPRLSGALYVWPHAVLHAIEVNEEQIILASIDFNRETRFDMRVLWIMSILLERIMLWGSTVHIFGNKNRSKRIFD